MKAAAKAIITHPAAGHRRSCPFACRLLRLRRRRNCGTVSDHCSGIASRGLLSPAARPCGCCGTACCCGHSAAAPGNRRRACSVATSSTGPRHVGRACPVHPPVHRGCGTISSLKRASLLSWSCVETCRDWPSGRTKRLPIDPSEQGSRWTVVVDGVGAGRCRRLAVSVWIGGHHGGALNIARA